MQNKIISVIIPVYNVERYLDQCLHSIIVQAEILDKIEVILVNDGSPDNCDQIIQKYATNYPNVIRVLNQDNQGLSMARNNGLDLAKGKYVWFVDSDDWLPEGSIEFVIQEIENNPQVDVFSSVLQQYHEKDDSFHFTAYQGELFYSGLSYLEKKLPSGASPRFICKRTFLNQNNLRYIPGILHEDAVWGFMMLYKALLVKIIEKPIYVYRIRVSDSIMSSIKIRTAYDLIKGHKLICEWMKESVAIKDYKCFRYLIFGLIKTLLSFTKILMSTMEYKIFINENKSYIRKQALRVICYKPYDISLLIIALNPKWFAFLCKVFNK